MQFWRVAGTRTVIVPFDADEAIKVLEGVRAFEIEVDLIEESVKGPRWVSSHFCGP